MKRDDSTSPEKQLAYRGVHFSMTGNWAYPRRLSSKRIRHSRQYLRCQCGWRLVGIPRTEKGRAESTRLFAEHFTEMKKARAARQAS